MTDTKMTPKAFRPHILVALAKVTGFRPSYVVPMKDIHDPIFARMGITEEQFGVVPGHTRLQTHHWCGIAFRKLKLDGLTGQEGRAKWFITETGLAEAVKILQAEGETVELPATGTGDASPTKAGDLLAEVTAAAEAAKDDSVDHVVVITDGEVEATAPESAPSEPEPEPEPADNIVELRRPDARSYHPDRKIRALAIQATKCFGYYSSRARACKVCPLAAECVQAVRAEYASLSQSIKAEQAKAERQAKAKKKVKAASGKPVSTDDLLEDLDAADSTPGKKKGKRKASRKTKAERVKAKQSKESALPIKARSNTKCGGCGKTIPNGEDVLWIEESGTFHKGCLA
jgi:hypothetical protein